MSSFSRSGTIVDIHSRTTFPGTVEVKNGLISRIIQDKKPKSQDYILPGFIDAHVHIESSMLIPSEFARLATVHGTVATVSDPHEIANVLGMKGIRYMIENGKKVPFHFFFGASSCVPATAFETAGASISAEDIAELLDKDGLKYLSEMMNYPGVLQSDPEVLAKLTVAHIRNKPVDGHAPGLMGSDARTYIDHGITTDHECYTLEEALSKISFGMKIIIREGSAAKNYQALHPIIKQYPELVMFCSDDKHPHELMKGHINDLVRRSVVDHGYDLMDVLRIACLHPVEHYGLDVGLLREGDPADFIVVNNLTEFKLLETYVRGTLVAKEGTSLIESVQAETPNQFNCTAKLPSDFKITATGSMVRVIQAVDGQLITKSELFEVKSGVPSINRDILKLTVVNRYKDTAPAVAFIQNFKLKSGAIATSVAHDSHNIIAVGCSDEEIAQAVNLLIENRGGIAVVNGNKQNVLALPVAGLMTNIDCFEAANKYAEMLILAKELGTTLHDPFMTLSFMALLVIPELKLSDKGLFDGKTFAFTELFS